MELYSGYLPGEGEKNHGSIIFSHVPPGIRNVGLRDTGIELYRCYSLLRDIKLNSVA
jgi:hypothetical protein